MASKKLLILDYFQQYLLNSILNYSLEIAACLAGTYYIFKKKNAPKSNLFFVYFLWFTLVVEIIGAYAPIAYFTNYEYFGFVKDTVYRNSTWLYNIYFLVLYTFTSYYFISILKFFKYIKVLKILLLVFVFIGVGILIISDVFVVKKSLFSSIIGSLLLLLMIVLFYFDLLKSDQIIELKKYLPVYLSAGLLFFTLCTTPLEIFSIYFNVNNDLFIKIRTRILLISNIIMYTTFVIGFLVCSKKDSKIFINKK